MAAADGWVRTADQARTLADRILDPARTVPFIVVSVSSGRDQPWVDVDVIRDNVDGMAEVAVVETGPAAWALTAQLPAGCDVYGGASRTYPPGSGWLTQTSQARLRFAYGPHDTAIATSKIISDALSMVRTTRPKPRGAVAAGGHVRKIVGGRGFVDLVDDGGLATIWPELVADGLTAEQLVQPGMAVWGMLDPVSHRLDVSGMCIGAPTALAEYAIGVTVPARVQSVSRSTATVELWPGVVATLTADEVIAGVRTSPTQVISTDEILAVRVLSTDPWRVSLIDVGEPCCAASVLTGGPPWLTIPEPVELVESGELDVAEAPDVAEVAAGVEGGASGESGVDGEPAGADAGAAGATPAGPAVAPSPATGVAADAAGAIVDDAVAQVTAELEQVRQRLARVETDLTRERAAARQLRTDLRKAKAGQARVERDAQRALDALRTTRTTVTASSTPRASSRSRSTSPGRGAPTRARRPTCPSRAGPSGRTSWTRWRPCRASTAARSSTWWWTCSPAGPTTRTPAPRTSCAPALAATIHP